MLEQLTEKMKVCLGRLRDEGLDGRSREKYQELVLSIRRQMDKLTDIDTATPSASPAGRRSSGAGCAGHAAAHVTRRFGGC